GDCLDFYEQPVYGARWAGRLYVLADLDGKPSSGPGKSAISSYRPRPAPRQTPACGARPRTRMPCAAPRNPAPRQPARPTIRRPPMLIPKTLAGFALAAA